jgi:hypothetical protein
MFLNLYIKGRNCGTSEAIPEAPEALRGAGGTSEGAKNL